VLSNRGFTSQIPSQLLAHAKHATVHEAIVPGALVRGKVGVDIDLLESRFIQ
jgi:hypothetical protein